LEVARIVGSVSFGKDNLWDYVGVMIKQVIRKVKC